MLAIIDVTGDESGLSEPTTAILQWLQCNIPDPKHKRRLYFLLEEPALEDIEFPFIHSFGSRSGCSMPHRPNVRLQDERLA